MKNFITIALLSIAAALAGCGDKDASLETLEQAKAAANENSLLNAQKFRHGNALYSGWMIVPEGDSSQTPNCPQGDGWATLTIMSHDKTQTVKLQCSTVSGHTGCLDEEAFKERGYASEDGQCQPTTKVPLPLPKIAK